MKTTKARIVTSFAFCLLALVTSSGCKKLSTNYKPVGDPQCTKVTLDSNVIATSTVAGGIAGRISTTTYYADGRVETNDGTSETTEPTTVRLPVARMQKLDRALAKVLIKAKQGCWSAPPIPDGTSASIAYQHNGTTYQLSANDGSGPSEMDAAFTILREVDVEAAALTTR